MQFSKQAEFVPAPDWYYGVEYHNERERGYDFKEDLFVPGYFELPIKKGESVIFSASTAESSPKTMKHLFRSELKTRNHRDTFLESLKNAAQQFVQQSNHRIGLVAGFPWYGQLARQSLVALPGLTLDLEDETRFVKILDHILSGLENGLLRANPEDPNSPHDSIDAPLWLFWAIQQYERKTKHTAKIWDTYGPAMKAILTAYKNGTDYDIHMLDSGLISGKAENAALTWMNSYSDGKPVVQRAGMPVEVNALWYNAICFALELAREQNDTVFVNAWKDWPEKIASSFTEAFWSEEKQYLADCITDGEKDWSIRPNMLIAAALEFSPIDRPRQKAVVSRVQGELLTPRGLRSLSPRDPRYAGICKGNVRERELAVHQGTAWPWLVAFFAEAYLKLHRRSGYSVVKGLTDGFEEELTDNCIGTISEMYDGDPPHEGRGAVSQAWSVAGLIHSFTLLENYEN
jgi:predicted glycogen debranching enzyme